MALINLNNDLSFPHYQAESFRPIEMAGKKHDVRLFAKGVSQFDRRLIGSRD
jgi:hypothetical protein